MNTMPAGLGVRHMVCVVYVVHSYTDTCILLPLFHIGPLTSKIFAIARTATRGIAQGERVEALGFCIRQ